MKYRNLNSYKYMTAETISFYVGIFPNGQLPIQTDFLTLSRTGHLTIRAGYCWDGASGPGIDTENLMTPSLVHDAGYQLIRMGLLPRHTKAAWDDLLKEMCDDRGMSELRQSWIHLGVSVGGRGSVEPDPEKDIVRIIEVP